MPERRAAIKRRLSETAQGVAGTLGEGARRIRERVSDGDEQVDQEAARLERARKDARKEAMQEARREFVDEYREHVKEEVREEQRKAMRKRADVDFGDDDGRDLGERQSRLGELLTPAPPPERDDREPAVRRAQVGPPLADEDGGVRRAGVGPAAADEGVRIGPGMAGGDDGDDDGTTRLGPHHFEPYGLSDDPPL